LKQKRIDEPAHWFLPTLSVIKPTRAKLGLSQRQLAKRAGITSSNMNKIENRNYAPNYDDAKSIFEELRREAKEQREKLESNVTTFGKTIANYAWIVPPFRLSEQVIHVKPTDTLEKALLHMNDYNLSRIPVITSHHISVGTVSLEGIRALVGKSRDNPEFQYRERTVKEAIEQSMPLLDCSSPARIALHLLDEVDCVLLTKEGRVCGYATKKTFALARQEEERRGKAA
jgi:predicted transcriptional regulator